MSDRTQRRLMMKRRAALEVEAFDCRQKVAAVDRVTGAHDETTRRLVHADIEQYVDSLARSVDLDESKVDVPPDPGFYEVVAGWGWHGARTAEEAKEEIEREVARRSVGKTDLALLLSSIDHTALTMMDTMPDPLRALRGGELVEQAARTLTLEDFGATLVSDPQWKKMRGRWVRLGWRLATTEEAFNAEFILAVAERMAEAVDRLARGLPPLGDTVLDEPLDRASPPSRAAMTAAFAERLDREFERLPSAVDWRRLAIMRESGESAQPSADHPPAPAPPQTEVRQRATPYSDHLLMRGGRKVWEQSYALGMTDEELRDQIGSMNAADTSLADELVLFAAKWAVHAFQRLQTSHTFAAALMCSDVDRSVLDGLERQWDAFLVLVPNGMLVAGGLEFSRVLVATYSFGARLILLTTGGPGLDSVATRRAALTGTITDEAPTLPDLLAGDGSDLHEDAQTRRCLVMAKRLVAGLLLNLQHPPNFSVRTVAARPKGLRREAEPEHRIVTVGKPLEVDCRAAVREYVEHGTKRGRRGPPTVQVMVRGHYKRQVCGVGRADRKIVWIEPFWRGNEAALIQTRAAKVR